MRLPWPIVRPGKRAEPLCLSLEWYFHPAVGTKDSQLHFALGPANDVTGSGSRDGEAGHCACLASGKTFLLRF